LFTLSKLRGEEGFCSEGLVFVEIQLLFAINSLKGA